MKAVLKIDLDNMVHAPERMDDKKTIAGFRADFTAGKPAFPALRR
jgi:hypothetical protein